MILVIEDNNGCQLRLPVSPLLIDGSIDNLKRVVDFLKGELQNKNKILKKISK